MSSLEADGLLARVRQLRRRQPEGADAPGTASARATPDGLEALELRIAHLEQMLQGLQDSVHREADRQGRRLADLEAQVQPAAMGKALSQDARERGL